MDFYLFLVQSTILLTSHKWEFWAHKGVTQGEYLGIDLAQECADNDNYTNEEGNT